MPASTKTYAILIDTVFTRWTLVFLNFIFLNDLVGYDDGFLHESNGTKYSDNSFTITISRQFQIPRQIQFFRQP